MAGKVPKDLKVLLRQVEGLGFTVTYTKKCHVQVRDAEGRVVAGTGGTPSDIRAIKNFRAQLRRGGVSV